MNHIWKPPVPMASGALRVKWIVGPCNMPPILRPNEKTYPQQQSDPSPAQLYVGSQLRKLPRNI